MMRLATRTGEHVAGTLVLVDDEQNVLDGLSSVLRGEPYEVLTATSGKACLEILERRAVDVIVADERMPGMPGSELLGKVARRYPATARIILTGRASVDAAARAINEGAIYRFLQKPYRSDLLVGVIRDAFRAAQLNGAAIRMLDVVHQESSRLVGRHDAVAAKPHWFTPAGESAALSNDMLDVLTPEQRRSISPRERDVLELLVAGRRVGEISKALFISTHTVRNHLKSLFSKLDVHSQAALRDRFAR